jgi:hypothetical protein
MPVLRKTQFAMPAQTDYAKSDELPVENRSVAPGASGSSLYVKMEKNT